MATVDQNRKLLERAAKTGNAGALGTYFNSQSTVPQTAGATTPPPTGATTAGTGTAYQKYLEMEARKERDRIMTSGDTRAINEYLQQENMNRTADRLADSGNTQAAEQMRRSMEAQARAKAALNGNQQQNNTYYQAQTPYQAAIAQAQPVTMNDYTWWNWMGENKLTNMSEGDKAKWDRAVTGWKNGDYSAFNDDFETVGNWSSYVDDNGNVNGMLRYVGDGVGGYIPVSNGVLLQNEGFSNDPNTYAFYGPNGEVYTADANGRLTRTGNWTQEVRERRVPDGGLHGTFKSSNGQTYDYDTAPEDVLASHGFYRGNDGLVRIMDDNDALVYAVKSGQATPEQAAIVNAKRMNGGTPSGSGYVPSSTNPTPTNYASEYTSRTTNPTPSTNPSTTPSTNPTVNPGGYQPTPADTVSAQASNQNNPSIYQQYLDQWSYPDAPEWSGTDYERQRDELLQNAMNPYEGSPYDQQRDDALAQYGEKWQGSEYQPRRDAALERAENMQWNYDPNTDPVWQALQKQYRREGDRATQEAMAQAAMRTGGLANSYAVTAASQAGDYYAAQLSDRLPQLYQDAYQRYLQEFQRQMGISDQYQGFDDREYARWADQQGKNLDLADRYNQYGQQDYNRYMDRVSQQLQGADRYNQYGGTEYQRYLDQLGQYNTDRNFSYGRYRDAVGDYRYDDETQYNRAWNEEARDYNRAYQAQRDAILDNRADREWAQELRAYADAQGWKQAEWEQYLREYGDQLSEKERQWAYQMARDAVEDNRWERQYADSRSDTMYDRALRENELDYDRAWNEENRDYTRAWNEENRDYSRNWDENERDYNRSWDTTKWEQALREYDDEMAQQAWNNDYKLSSKSSGGTGGSGGGSKSGGTKNSGSDAAAPAPASTTAPASSGNYDKALSDVRAYRNTHSTTEVLQYIKRLINEGTITDDEASQMLLYFGYVTGSGGGGSYAPGSPNNVLMTK